jgi:sulfatase maturation enzyme AslB (radical SAM superfamily)
VQKKEKKTIDNTCIDTAVDFFYPFFEPDGKIHIGFYGGEPLLAYEQVKHATLLISEKNKTGNKKMEFSLTTNGTLLTDEMLDFFDCRGFSLTLSFDGLAQEKSRKQGTLDKMIKMVKRIRNYRGINFEINSVFAPGTVHMLSGSLRFMIEPGGPDITFSLNTLEEWNPFDLETLKRELKHLTDYLALFHKKTGKIPVKNFQAPAPAKESSCSRVFRCSAGTDHMAVSPEGDIWGCFLFHDYFKTRKQHPQYKDYYFGTLTDFIADYKTRCPTIAANYAELRQDLFQVDHDFCFLCDHVTNCTVCPINAAYSSGTLGKISCRQCELNKIELNARGGAF